eukprot:132504_1
MRFEFCVSLFSYSIFFIQCSMASFTGSWAEPMLQNAVTGWESTDNSPPIMHGFIGSGETQTCRTFTDHCWYWDTGTTGSYQSTIETTQYNNIKLSYAAWSLNVNEGNGDSCYIDYSNNEIDFERLATISGTTQSLDVGDGVHLEWSDWAIPVADMEALTIKIGATLTSGNNAVRCFFNEFYLIGTFIPSPHPTKFPSATPGANPSISPT